MSRKRRSSYALGLSSAGLILQPSESDRKFNEPPIPCTFHERQEPCPTWMFLATISRYLLARKMKMDLLHSYITVATGYTAPTICFKIYRAVHKVAIFVTLNTSNISYHRKHKHFMHEVTRDSTLCRHFLLISNINYCIVIRNTY